MLSSAIFQEIKSLMQPECCQGDVSAPREPPQAQCAMGQPVMLAHRGWREESSSQNRLEVLPHIPQSGTGRYLINEKGQGYKCNARV